MTRAALWLAVVALLAAANPARAESAERPPEPETTLLVHVHNGSTDLPAAEGLPVFLSVEVDGRWEDVLEGHTEAGGVARIAVPMAMAERFIFRCTAVCGDYKFFSRPFRIGPDRPATKAAVTVYEPSPNLGLPPWTAAALMALFALALALIALRRSDRQLDHASSI